MKALLSSTFFGPIQWYQKLCRYPEALIEQHDSYRKQTYRNRCLIATAQGAQALTVPVAATVAALSPEKTGAAASPDWLRSVGAIRLSNHGHWQHQHWQAITSAYGDSPFLEYYEDDLRPFFFETDRWERLIDYNEAIRQKMCELLDIHPHVEPTTHYEKKSADKEGCCQGDVIDYRDAIRPKQAPADLSFEARPYYQVFRQRLGFLPNLSILDLLLNMGPESIYYL